ncbi:MAG: DNA polymerase I [Burkholderiales bacterium]|nr:DNA polymerase I [Burkholderiales bacterium]
MPNTRHDSRAERLLSASSGDMAAASLFFSPMKTLLLVDGSSYLYRAFHALPDLRNSRGEPTGAIHGVLNMLRRLQRETPADYIACVFDAKGRTFRDDAYPGYKANRAPMPDELGAQIAPLKDAIAAMGWPLIEVEGVEADDVIGTLATRAAAAGMRVVISTGDKDLAQLVTPRVKLVNTMSNEVLDEAGVGRKFGVPPERIVDYLTLVGDSVDNVPGVEKVGPKTAVKWLSRYGSLDAIIDRAAEIGGVVGENLRKARDWLPKARELLTIRRDVPLAQHVEELAPRVPDAGRIAELFDRLELRTLRRELLNGLAAGAAEEAAPPRGSGMAPAPALAGADHTRRSYETIVTEAQLSGWIERLERAGLAAFDTETTSLDPMQARLVGLSFAVEPGRAAYVPLAHRYAGAPEQLAPGRVLERLKPWLASEARAKVCQNAKYDMHVLANHGVALAGVRHDTLIESYLLESHRAHDMDSLAARHLSLKTITYDEVTGKGASRIAFDQVSVERATEYAAEDADVTLRLHHALYPRLESEEKLERLYREIEMPVLRVLQAMERHGVLLDVALLAELSRFFGAKMAEVEARAHAEAGQPFNLNSPRQIQELLFERKGLPVIKKTPGGTPSTDEDVLAELALDHPLPKLILEYRGLSKLKSTYTDKLPAMINPATGRVHTNYGQAVAVTGRLASNDPNLQNIPIRTAEGRRIREAFVAPAGAAIVSADYSQIELRIMAHLSRDARLLEAFAAGEDIHRATAAELFGALPAAVGAEQRRTAKVINFGLIYGMSAFGLARELGLARGAAQQYMERYFARYPGVKRYMDETRARAREQGCVETVFGRRLWLPEIASGAPARRQAAERAAINAPMQGTAADLIKMAMIAVARGLERERLGARLVMQVHDELVLEVPVAELEAVRCALPELMAGVARLAVPLVVDVGAGPNWEKAH